MLVSDHIVCVGGQNRLLLYSFLPTSLRPNRQQNGCEQKRNGRGVETRVVKVKTNRTEKVIGGNSTKTWATFSFLAVPTSNQMYSRRHSNCRSINCKTLEKTIGLLVHFGLYFVKNVFKHVQKNTARTKPKHLDPFRIFKDTQKRPGRSTCQWNISNMLSGSGTMYD